MESHFEIFRRYEYVGKNQELISKNLELFRRKEMQQMFLE